MGAFQGPLTYKLFYVQGSPPADVNSLYLPQIQGLAFQPLSPEQEADVSSGWVVIDSPFLTEFTVENVFFGSYINLSLREDRYVLPSRLLRAHTDQEEQRRLQETGKKSLNKFEREDVRSFVEQELRQQVIPRMQTIDMSWDLPKGRVRFWNQSPKKCELLQGLFYDTFGLELIAASVFSTFTQMEFDQASRDRLSLTETTKFTDGVVGIDF